MSLCSGRNDHFVPVECHQDGMQLPPIREQRRQTLSSGENRERPGLAPILLLNKVFQRARRGFMDVEFVTNRVRAEFEEMPGMTLTMPQASRLFGIEGDTCKA